MFGQLTAGAAPFVVSSDGGACYFRQVPTGQYSNTTSLGHGYAYRVGGDGATDALLWETDWFGGPVVLANNGHVLARVILTPDEQTDGSDPTVLIFYRDGAEFRSYRLSEIATPADGLSTWPGGWCTGELHEWRDNGVEMIDVSLARGRVVSFNLCTGDRVEGESPHQHGGSNSTVQAERERPESDGSSYVLAGGALIVGVVLGALLGRHRSNR